MLGRSRDRAHSTLEQTKRQRPHLHTVGRFIALGRVEMGALHPFNRGNRRWWGIPERLRNSERRADSMEYQLRRDTNVRPKVLPHSLAAIALAIANVFVGVSLIARAPAGASSAPSCRPGQMAETVRLVAMKPPSSSIAWEGQVAYKNTGATCEMARSTVLVVAETSSAASPRPLTKRYSLTVRGNPFTVGHGDGAHTWVEVTDTQPKNWTPIVCPASAVSGLEVGGPSRTWPLKYFAINPAVGVCFAFIIKAASGSLAPGA